MEGKLDYLCHAMSNIRVCACIIDIHFTCMYISIYICVYECVYDIYIYTHIYYRHNFDVRQAKDKLEVGKEE